MEQGALCGVLALGNTATAHTDLVVQTLSGGLAGRGTDAKAAEHACRTLFFGSTKLELGTSQGWVACEAGLTEATGHMVCGPTVCVLTANIGQATHVHTLVPHTGSVAGAFGVVNTL